MTSLTERFRAWCRTEPGRKKVRYFLASVITTFVSQAVLFLTNYGRIATAVECSCIATAAGAIPSYYLNRKWAWGKSSRSHIMKEVLPFWVLAFVGLFASIGTVAFADHQAKTAAIPHLAITVVDNAAYLLAFVIVWFLKFVIFDKLVFVDHHDGAAGDAAASGGELYDAVPAGGTPAPTSGLAPDGVAVPAARPNPAFVEAEVDARLTPVARGRLDREA